jgi:hypothetical protein
MLADASMIPISVLVVPSVAELPIAQLILSLNIVPVLVMIAPLETVRVEPILKVQESPATPVIVTGPVIKALEVKQITGVTPQLIGDRVVISVAAPWVTLQANPFREVK